MSELYVLDTDCFTLFQFGHAAVVAHASDAARLAITIVTVDESLTGWYSRLRQSKTPEQLATVYRGLHRTVDALRHMEVLPYSQLAIEHQLRLRHQFRRLGKMDLEPVHEQHRDFTEISRNALASGSRLQRNRTLARCG